MKEKTMKRILLLSLVALIFLSGFGAFLWCFITDGDAVFFAPMAAMLLCSGMMIFLLIKEIFIGYNEYRVSPSEIEVSRRDKAILCVQKAEISRATMIHDMISGELYAVLIYHEKRCLLIPLSEDNREALLALTEGIPKKKRSNFLYYLIIVLSG